MSRRSPKAQAALDAAKMATDEAREQGREYFKTAPNLMLVEVSRRGSMLFANNQHMVAFLQGYIEARANHEAFRRGE